MRSSAVLLALAVLVAANAVAQEDPVRRIDETTAASGAERLESQAALDAWAGERAALKQRWETAAAQVAYLEERAALERERLAGLEAAGDELARRLEEAGRLEASLEDTLLSILGRLDDVVARDLPFLREERATRLATIRRELGDPGAGPADKLRRVLETLLIEMRYGGALEVYASRIDVGGEELTCDLLYVGRLGLFWLTPEAARGGAWNPATRRFESLEGDGLSAVRRAVEMATRRRAVGVQDLPLGRLGS